MRNPFKRKRLQSSLEEWENEGRQNMAQRNATLKDAEIGVRHNSDQVMSASEREHPLLKNAIDKRASYQEALGAMRHGERSLEDGHGSALSEDLHNQFSQGAAQPEQPDTLTAILERIQGIEDSLSALQQSVEKQFGLEMEREEAQPPHGIEDEPIGYEAQTKGEPQPSVQEQYKALMQSEATGGMLETEQSTVEMDAGYE